MTTRRPTALIFRKRILPWSETFIAAQAGTMTRYAPVLAGYHREPSGEALLGDMPRVLLDAHSPVPALSKFLLKQFGRLPTRWLRAIRAYRPVIVHAHFGSSVVPGRLIARSLDIPLVVTYHGMDITVRAGSGAELARRREAFAAATTVIAVSEYIARRVREAGCPPEKVVVHYIGVDTAYFSPGTEARSDTRVLFVGRLVAKKGVIHLVRAMREVQRAVPEAELVIAGDGDLRADLEQAAREAGVRATFLGVQTPEQVRALMRGAAVVAGPSIVDARGNDEGLGLVFIEAQACGTPVVVSTSGGAGEGVVDGETGLLFAPGDEAALAQHLLTLLGDKEQRARMGAAARAHVEQRFDLRKQTAVLERIFDAVLSKHRE
jgi:glycosyltransferase involved in cell wall biosynthesis